MNFKGVITHIFEAKSGVSASGKEWHSQDFRVEEQNTQYPQSVILNVFNNKVTIPPIGTFVDAQINANSKEWQGRFFNALQCWKLDAINTTSNQPAQSNFGNPVQTAIQPQFTQQQEEENDLPF